MPSYLGSIPGEHLNVKDKTNFTKYSSDQHKRDMAWACPHKLIKIKLKMKEQSYICIRGHIGRKNNIFEFWTQHYLGSKVYHFICSTLNALSHGRSSLALYDMERLEEVVLS